MKLLQLKSRTEGQFNRSIDAIVQWILEHPKGSLQISFPSSADATRVMKEVTERLEKLKVD